MDYYDDIIKKTICKTVCFSGVIKQGGDLCQKTAFVLQEEWLQKHPVCLEVRILHRRQNLLLLVA